MLALGNCEEENRRGLARALVAFAGLEFELAGDAELCAQLARAASGASTVRAAANTLSPKFPVRCRLHASLLAGTRPLGGAVSAQPQRLAWRWSDAGGEVSTRFGRATVSENAPGIYAGEAWLAADARAAHFVLSGLAALLIHRAGGVILHAASVLHEGSVIAFVGPSGAGKSTACQHVEQAELFSVDRLALCPSGTATAPRWLAHPLPGGTPPVPDMPAAAACWRPLRGVLRVHQAEQVTSLAPSTSAAAVAALRESAFQAGTGPSVEAELLEALEALARGTPVGRLYLKLGASLAPVLGRWLVDQAEDER